MQWALFALNQVHLKQNMPSKLLCHLVPVDQQMQR
jgi:hypothetical protein